MATLQIGNSRPHVVDAKSAGEAVVEYLKDCRVFLEYIRINDATREIQIKTPAGNKVVIEYDPVSGFQVVLC